MAFFLLHHSHEAHECAAAFAAWQGLTAAAAPAGALQLPGRRPRRVVAGGGAGRPRGARAPAAVRGRADHAHFDPRGPDPMTNPRCPRPRRRPARLHRVHDSGGNDDRRLPPAPVLSGRGSPAGCAARSPGAICSRRRDAVLPQVVEVERAQQLGHLAATGVRQVVEMSPHGRHSAPAWRISPAPASATGSTSMRFQKNLRSRWRRAAQREVVQLGRGQAVELVVGHVRPV